MNGKEFDETSTLYIRVQCEWKATDRPVELGDGMPIGPSGAVGYVGGVRKGMRLDRRRAGRNNHWGECSQERYLPQAVTITAITVDLRQLVFAIGGLRFYWMLMLVMAVMVGCRRLFMLTIRGSRCPGQLER